MGKEIVLQDMTNTPINIGRCFGIKINAKRTKVMRISWQPSPVQITDQKQLENVEYLGSMITNTARCTRWFKYDRDKL
jgi:hypothetical protein